MLRSILVATTITGLLAGCAIPGTTLAPTAYPADYIPTVIHLTAQSIDSTHAVAVTPSVTPTAQAVIISPTSVPSDTPTSAPGVPLAAIQINAPGPMSRVVSPLDVHLVVVAGASKLVAVDLYGEDDSHLGGSTRPVAGSPTGDPLFVKIPFQIRTAGETGTVQVSTKDGNGRLQSLTIVRVLLLSSGVNQINPPGNTIYERVTFYDLTPNMTVSGGVLALEGKMLPYNQQPVILDLVGEDGKSLGPVRVLPNLGPYSQDFQTTIPYKVSASTQARLFVREVDDVLTGLAYVYSQPITLNP